MNDEDCILIVDDNTDNIRLITDYLRESEFKTAFAKDGTVGLERARLLHPSLILLDIMMPPPDGFETCRNLKSGDDTREIPVIFMTALANVEDKVKAFELGAVDYMDGTVGKAVLFAKALEGFRNAVEPVVTVGGGEPQRAERVLEDVHHHIVAEASRVVRVVAIEHEFSGFENEPVDAFSGGADPEVAVMIDMDV